MGMKELNEAFELIEQNKDLADFEDPKPESLIHSAELALGLKFPPTYRLFLEKLGCGDIVGQEFYGLVSEDFYNSGVPDAIWVTLQNRDDLPYSLIVIYDLGDGTVYCIDTSQKDENGECPVVIWDPHTSEPGCELEIEAPDFGTFFLNFIKDALRN